MAKKVLIGLSGGVDSSVSAYLLQKEGYEVEGVYMKLHNASQEYHKKNLEIIDKVCKYLNIKYTILDLSSEFEKEVYDYFVQSYMNGVTPNPCVKCNRNIKFGRLFEYMKKLGADYLSTGHYATTDGEFIKVGKDRAKDQSYFLAQIKKEVIPYLIFPMNQYEKSETKKIAASIPELSELASKKESQEICFVDGEYTDILEKHTNIDMPGITLDKDGNEVGNHKGFMHYTIGKRRGFYVHGAHDPHFVLSMDPKKNTITVGKKDDLEIHKVKIDNLNMFIDDKEFKCGVKLRYRSKELPCHVKIDGYMADIELFEPSFGVAAGQCAVFYKDDKVIGSGWIIKAN